MKDPFSSRAPATGEGAGRDGEGILRDVARRVASATWRTYSRAFNTWVRRRCLVRDSSGHPLDFRAPEVADERFQAAMRNYRPTRHREWIYDLRAPCYIEPSRGFVFGPRGQRLLDPFNYYFMLDEIPLRRAVSLATNRDRIQALNCAVSLRCFTEGNYWHFYDDVLSKLRLVDGLGLAPDVPLLVGERLWQQRFFREAISRGRLRERNWMQHTAMVRVDRLIIAVPMSFQRVNVQYALSALEAPPSSASERRLFVTRSANQRRQLVNVGDLVSVLEHFRFEIVDPDGMSLADQMALFGSGRLVVANHGSGLANLIFRIGQPVRVVEMFPPDYIHPHFVWLAQAFGFDYDALVGEATGGGDFRIEPDLFRAAIAAAVDRVESPRGG